MLVGAQAQPQPSEQHSPLRGDIRLTPTEPRGRAPVRTRPEAAAAGVVSRSGIVDEFSSSFFLASEKHIPPMEGLRHSHTPSILHDFASTFLNRNGVLVLDKLQPDAAQMYSARMANETTQHVHPAPPPAGHMYRGSTS